MAFHISVMPEQAIIRSADASKPTKARVDDTVHPKVTVEFDYNETQYAVVRLLIPPQDEVGAFDSDSRLDLRYVSASALSGNVQFGVKYALIDISEGQDKALSSEVASTISAYAGSSNTEHGVSFTLTGVFSGLDTTKRYTLVLQITRKQPASDLAADVSWISGVLRLSQTPTGSVPSEPPADSSEVYLKFQDGKGSGITLTDSSGNGRDITATTTVTRIANHPIAGKFLTTHNTSNLTTPAFNVGPYYSLELLLEVAGYVSVGDQICNYAVPPSVTSQVFGIRVDSVGGVRYLAAGPTWTYFSTRIPLSTVVYLGLYREDAGSGQVTDSLWINGSLVETSAAFTPTNSASASHALMLIGGGWNKSHLRFWGTTRTDVQKKAASNYFFPWLKRS